MSRKSFARPIPSDIRFDGSQAPVVDLNGADPGTSSAIFYIEGGTATAIAPNATVTDADSPNFDGGTLTVQLTANGAEGDRLAIINGGLGVGQITVSENEVFYDFGRLDGDQNPVGPELIGTFAGGLDPGDPLVVTLNATADQAAVQALVRAIGFYSISDGPGSTIRTATFTLTDGDGGVSTPATATIEVTDTPDPAVAEDDTVSAFENQLLTGNVFDNNGGGNDHDPDGTPFEVIAVDGSAAAVGNTITLASGALLTLNADGTFTYDPNGAFDDLVDPSSGAVNTFDNDAFTYTVTGGDTADVTVVVTGATGPGTDAFFGDAADNAITGNDGPGAFLMMDGGIDSVTALGGNDFIYFGASLTTDDSVNGGAGTDTLALLGDYNLTLGADELAGIERLVLYSGGQIPNGAHVDYSLTLADAAVAAGSTLTVVGRPLLSDESLVFNGAAETDARFVVYGGAGADTLVGGRLSDFLTGGAGDDQLFGQAGDDFLRGGLGADTLRGGTGFDRFTFGSVDDSNLASADHIADFQAIDRIDLSEIDADGNAGNGDTAFTWIGNAAFSNTAGELRYSHTRGGVTIQGDTNGDGAADLFFSITLVDASPIDAGDFIL